MTTFDIHFLAGFTEHVSGGIRKAAMRGALSASMRLVQHITTEIIPKETPQPVDRGHYRSGFEFEATDDGADVFNTIPYASIIENGARADNIKIGRVMIDAIAQWIIRKGLVGKARGAKAKADQITEARNIAWAIATAMKKRGIFNRNGFEGLRVVEKAMLKAREFLEEEISREITRAFE